MMQNPNKYDQIILTSNQRMAFSLDKAISFQDWLIQNFQSSSSPCSYQLLTKYQEKLWWEKIIKRAGISFSIPLSAFIELLQSAWDRLFLWNISLDHPDLVGMPEGRLFAFLAKKYQQDLAENRFITQAELAKFVKQLILQEKISLPRQIILKGFLDISPAYSDVLSALKWRGVEIKSEVKQEKLADRHYVSFMDQEAEMFAMARWAKQILLKDPEARIGCAIGDLPSMHRSIRRIFNEVFLGEEKFHVGFSVGESLFHLPIINLLLRLLKAINISPPSTEEINYLSRSVFVDVDKMRASFISSMSEIFRGEKKTRAGWVTVFRAQCADYGWPGKRTLTEGENKILKKWEEILQIFVELDNIFSAISVETALDQLEQLVKQTDVHEDTGSAPIQILGLLEAEGLPFSRLWILGLNQTNWPTRSAPHPLIPIALQRENNMPHAEASRELNFCQKIMQEFARGKAQVIYSHAKQIDGKEIAPSSLMREYLEILPEQLSLAPFVSKAQGLFHTRKNEGLNENEKAPPVSKYENIHGGTRILKEQAACPFRAFGLIRLKAETEEIEKIGIHKKLHGIFLHDALDRIWRVIKSQEKLLNLSHESLAAILWQAISEAIPSVLQTMQQKATENFLRLEKTRLFFLLTKWVQIEKTRLPFRVLTQEKWDSVQLGRLKIKFKSDRMDQLLTGERVFIDYKTGQVSELAWEGERLDEPQLPIYVVASKEAVQGVAFAQIREENMQFKSISETTPLFPKGKAIDKTAWEALLNAWQKNLCQLAEDFYEGVANISPKYPEKTCRYCQLRGFCRVDEK